MPGEIQGLLVQTNWLYNDRTTAMSKNYKIKPYLEKRNSKHAPDDDAQVAIHDIEYRIGTAL